MKNFLKAGENNVQKNGQKNDQMMLRGAIVTLIGAVILLGPYILRSQDLRELLRGAYVVGWFGLVLGLAMIGVDLLRRLRR
jgi:hypothetical protein